MDHTVKDGFALARKVQVALIILNLSSAGTVFAHKLVALCGGIAGLYFLFKLINIQPVVSVVFFVCALNSIAFYTVMWDNASLIPVMMRELKGQLGLVAATGRVAHSRYYWRRVCKSIPCTGVRVGGFRSMERDSTPIFMDFVLTNLASLLVAF